MDHDPWRCCCHEVAEAGMGGGVHCCLKAWAQLVGGHGEGSGAPWDTALSLSPDPPAHLLAPRPGALEGLGRKPRLASHPALCHGDPQHHLLKRLSIPHCIFLPRLS